jgi:hypothetical protein
MVISGLVTISKTFIQSMIIYYLPKVYNSFTDELACARQEMPTTDTALKLIAMIFACILLVEILCRLLQKTLWSSFDNQPAHPMFIEFLKKVFMALIIVIKGLYNPYFSLMSLSTILIFFPVSWTLPRSVRVCYAVILMAGVVQLMRQHYSWGKFTDEYMTEAICTDHSNWHYLFSFVVGGSVLSSIGLIRG